MIGYLLQEGGTKLIISKCEASRNGDYLGAMFESEYMISTLNAMIDDVGFILLRFSFHMHRPFIICDSFYASI